MKARIVAVMIGLVLVSVGCNKKNQGQGADGNTPGSHLGNPESPVNPVASDKEFLANAGMPLNMESFLATRDVEASKHCFQLVKKKSDGAQYLQISNKVCPAGNTLVDEDSVRVIYELVLTPGIYNSTKTSFELVDKDTGLEVGNMFVNSDYSTVRLFSLCSSTYGNYTSICDIYGDSTTKLLDYINAE